MPFGDYSLGSVYLFDKPTVPDFIGTNRSPLGSRRSAGRDLRRSCFRWTPWNDHAGLM